MICALAFSGTPSCSIGPSMPLLFNCRSAKRPCPLPLAAGAAESTAGTAGSWTWSWPRGANRPPGGAV
eukprot:8341628-Lingulodinium_polyedra.AAC.1